MELSSLIWPLCPASLGCVGASATRLPGETYDPKNPAPAVTIAFMLLYFAGTASSIARSVISPGMRDLANQV
jgi:hypothetical protein